MELVFEVVVACSVLVVFGAAVAAVFTRSIIRPSMIKSMRRIKVSKSISLKTETGVWPMKSINTPPCRYPRVSSPA